MHSSALGRVLLAVLSTTALVACGPSTLHGKVSDAAGSQQQGLSSSSATGGFGGSGSVSATSSVQLMEIGAGGALSVLATANVSATGEYSLDAPSGHSHAIVQGLDAQGNVVGQAVVESTGGWMEQVAAPPMTTETAVEAAVLIQMVQGGAELSSSNAVDLRARINSQVAVAVKGSSNPDAKVQALADAVIAAQRSQEESYKQSGKTVTQDQLFQAELQAAAHLNVALDRGDSADSAYAAFDAELASARASLGVTAQMEAKSESSASASFRATVEARLPLDAVADAAVRQAAANEAIAATAAINVTLKAAGATDATLTAATNAATTLKSSLAASTSAASSAQAYAAFSASMEGTADVTGSVLGDFLAVNGSNASSVNAAISAQVSASDALNSGLNTTFASVLSLTGTVNFSALATSVASAYAAFQTSVDGQAGSLSSFGTKASAALDVMVVVGGSFSG